MYHGFYWDSPLSEERKKEIRKWMASLNKKEEGYLEDLLEDVRDKTESDGYDE